MELSGRRGRRQEPVEVALGFLMVGPEAVREKEVAHIRRVRLLSVHHRHEEFDHPGQVSVAIGVAHRVEHHRDLVVGPGAVGFVIEGTGEVGERRCLVAAEPVQETAAGERPGVGGIELETSGQVRQGLFVPARDPVGHGAVPQSPLLVGIEPDGQVVIGYGLFLAASITLARPRLVSAQP
ncbi:hypothetical protein OG389_25085 [Streptomyces sp. NBC_00435]